LLKLSQRELAPRDLEQSSNHSSDLVAEKAVAEELQVDAGTTEAASDVEQGADRWSNDPVRNRERRHVATPRQQPDGGREFGLMADPPHDGGTKPDPWQGGLTPPHPIPVELAVGAPARVKSCSDSPHGAHPDVDREMLVETLLKAFGWDHHGQIDVSHLAGGVDTGVGPAGTDERGRDTARHRCQCTLEFALYRALGRLPLPTVEPRAEVGDGELYPMFHIGYPRTGEETDKGVRAMTVTSMLMLQVVLGAGVLSSGEVRYFPGSYFDDVARDRLQQKAMVRWPGPSELRLLWREGGLNNNQRIALLLGAAAHHDASLLDLYLEAVLSDSQRLRQAGAYGYRDLIGDLQPNVVPGVDDDAARRLAAEIEAVRSTLRFHSMVEMWLQAALQHEPRGLQGSRGILQRRPSDACFRAVERLMGPEDLEVLIRAYRIAEDYGNRFPLLKLIEALTLNQFIVMPLGDHKGWGVEVYEDGLDLLDEWIAEWVDGRCELDYGRVVSASLARMGAVGVGPLDPDACAVWGMVLDQGDPRWWAVAARRLYECGGPWMELSVLQAQSKQNRWGRDFLLNWFGLRDSGGRPTNETRGH